MGGSYFAVPPQHKPRFGSNRWPAGKPPRPRRLRLASSLGLAGRGGGAKGTVQRRALAVLAGEQEATLLVARAGLAEVAVGDAGLAAAVAVVVAAAEDGGLVGSVERRAGLARGQARPLLAFALDAVGPPIHAVAALHAR